jgi:hypothetical protein
VGETLLKEFVLEDVSSTSDSMTSSFHLLRLLNEVQDDLARHGSATYSAAVSGRDSAERMGAVLAVSAAIAEARVRVADACYSELDVSVNALDRRLKLMDAILKLHGQGMGGEVTKEEKLEVLTRPVDSISSRVRRPREGGGGGGGGGGGDGPPSLMVQLAAATGGGGALGKAASSPGALDVAIGTYEPRYCEKHSTLLPPPPFSFFSPLTSQPHAHDFNLPPFSTPKAPAIKWHLVRWWRVTARAAPLSGSTWLAWG